MSVPKSSGKAKCSVCRTRRPVVNRHRFGRQGRQRFCGAECTLRHIDVEMTR